MVNDRLTKHGVPRWTDSELKFLPLRFIAFGDAINPPVGVDDAFALGAALNEIFSYTGIQFSIQYEYLSAESLPEEYQNRLPNENDCQADHVADGNCDCTTVDDDCCAAGLMDGGDCYDQFFNGTRGSSPGCDALAGNGKCDVECNLAQFSFDGGDCCAVENQYCSWGLCCIDPSSSRSLQQKIGWRDLGFDMFSVAFDQNVWQASTRLSQVPALKVYLLPSSEYGGWSMGDYFWGEAARNESLGVELAADRHFLEGIMMVQVRPDGPPGKEVEVLAHEVGHSLGLDHMFADDCEHQEFQSSWSGGDFILDTPAVPLWSGYSGCKLSDDFNATKFDRCVNTSLVLDLYQEVLRDPVKEALALGNYMNYGKCKFSMGNFSPNQIARMQCAVEEVYHDFLQTVVSATTADDNADTVFVGPEPGALLEAGASLQFRLRSQLVDAQSAIQVALVPASIARGMRLRDVLQRANILERLSPYFLTERTTLNVLSTAAGDDEYRVPLQYLPATADGRRAYVTKGHYTIALIVFDDDDDQVPEVMFSAEFSVGYRTCTAPVPAGASQQTPVLGVARPRSECQARQSSVVGHSLDNGLVCCHVVDRPLSDDLGVLFRDVHSARGGRRAIDVSKSHPSTLEKIPERQLGEHRYELIVNGGLFIGAPFALKLRLDMQSFVFGEIRSQVKTLELRPYGHNPSGPVVAPLNLLKVALNDPIYGDQNAKAVDDFGTDLELVIRLPSSLPERLYFVYAKARNNEAGAAPEVFSVPFELNLAPCSVTAPGVGGTCRPVDQCAGGGAASAAAASGQLGCENFLDEFACCLGDSLSVDGNYRAVELDEAPDSASQQSQRLIFLSVALGGVLLCGIFMAIGVSLLLARRRRQSQSQPHNSDRHRVSRVPLTYAGGRESGGSRSNPGSRRRSRRSTKSSSLIDGPL